MKNRIVMSAEVRALRFRLRLRLVELMREGNLELALALSEEFLRVDLVDFEDLKFVRETARLAKGDQDLPMN
jgi:hypothetical protein